MFAKPPHENKKRKREGSGLPPANFLSFSTKKAPNPKFTACDEKQTPPATSSKANLLEICTYVGERTRQLLPISANRDLNSHNNEFFKRNITLNAMRSALPIKNILLDCHFNITKPDADSLFRKTRVSVGGVRPSTVTLEDLNALLASGPKLYSDEVCKDDNGKYTMRKMETMAVSAVSVGIGNCNEHADTNFSMLLEYPRKGLSIVGGDLPSLSDIVTLEVFCIKDHAFVVVNRPVGSLKFSEWEKSDAIIVDSYFDGSPTAYFVSGEDNPSLRYIRKRADSLTLISTSATIGEGHSEKWRKSEFYLLSEAKPCHNDNETLKPLEQFEWVELPRVKTNF